MHHPTDRITHTTAFVTPVVEYWLEREIAQWVFRSVEGGALAIGPDGAMAMSSAYGLLGTGFASRYRLQPKVGF